MLTEPEFLKAYDAYADAIFRYCYFRLYDRERALDLMQETFLKTWEYGQKRRHKSIENLRAFLYKVARNLVINEAKKRRPVSLDALEEAGVALPATDFKISDRLDARRALALAAQLEPKYREPLLLRFVEELGPKEIAELLNITENNVSVRINRGIHQLRKLMKIPKPK